MHLNFLFRLNSLLIPPLGLLLNFALLWLILTKTPKEMWLHSRILLQTCILDILILFLSLFAMPIETFVDGKIVIFFDGYFVHFFQNLSPICLWLLFLSFCFFFHFDVFAIAVQFLYRFLLLNRDIRLNFWQYSILLSISFFASICSTFLTNSIILAPIPNPSASIDFSNLLVDFNQNPIFAVFSMNDSASFRAILLMIPLYSFAYSLYIFCGIKIVKFVAAYAMNERLRELNKQLTKTLIIWASYPLFFQALIVFILYSSIFANSMQNAALFVLFLIAWLPVLNPMASLWTFRPYRDALMAPFKRVARIEPNE